MRLRLLATGLPVGLVALVLALAPARAQEGQRAPAVDARAEVEALLTTPGRLGAAHAHAGTVAADGDVVVATDVAIAWEATLGDGAPHLAAELTAPRIEVHGLSATTGGGYAATRIVVPEALVIFRLDTAAQPVRTQIAISSIVLEDGAWDVPPRLAADPSRPVSRFAPIVDWVTRQSYARLAVEQVRATTTAGAERQTLTYGPVRAGPAADGRIESLEYGEFVTTQTLTLADATGATRPAALNVRYGPVTGRDLDLKPYAQLLTGTPAGAPGVADGPQRIAASLSIAGAHATLEGAFDLALGAISLEDLTVDPDRGPLMARLDPLVPALAGGDATAAADLSLVALDYVGAFAARRLAVADLTSIAADGVTTGIAQVVLDGLSAAGIDRLSLVATDVHSDQIAATAALIEIAEVVFPPREAVRALFDGHALDETSLLRAMPYHHLSRVRDASLTHREQGTARIGLYELALDDHISAVPTRVRLRVEDLELPSTPDLTSQMMLQALDALPLTIDGTIALDWTDGTVDLAARLAVERIGEIDAQGAITGIPRRVIEAPSRMPEALATAALARLTARFNDRGVMSAALGMMAEGGGVTADTLATMVAQQVREQVASALSPPEPARHAQGAQAEGGRAEGNPPSAEADVVAERVAAAVKAFLVDPQSLTIRLRPDEPVPLIGIAATAATAPWTFYKVMKPSVSANE